MPMVYLVTEVFGLTSAALSAIANAYIIFLFAIKRIRSPDSLRLALYLSIGDLGYAVAALFHLGYLAFNWTNEYLNYNPYIIIISNCFLPAYLKFIITISISMAVDRIMAIYKPVNYHQGNRLLYANIVFFIATLWFSIDFLFQLLSSEYKRNPNCPTMACFVNSTFLNYTSCSNSIAGLLIILMSIVVFAGLRTFKMKQKRTMTSLKSSSVFQQANRICVGILFCSLFFVTIPSLLVTMYEKITGVSLFVEVGPFYIACILLNGIADSIVLLYFNRKFIMYRQKNRLHNNTKVTFSQQPVDNNIINHIMCNSV